MLHWCKENSMSDVFFSLAMENVKRFLKKAFMF
jgi:hypothetical protein